MSETRVAEARSHGERVAVKFEAAWCGDCVALDGALRAGAVELDVRIVTVDADAPESASLLQRLAILELPTVVVLEPDGEERGRIVGFADAATFRDAFAAVQRGARTLEALTADTDSRAGQLTGAEAQLSRDPEAALDTLNRLAAGDDDIAAEALHRLGRYHQRARRDPDFAATAWERLFTRFEDHPRALGAVRWRAQAWADAGDAARGGALFAERNDARPHDADLILVWAAFAGREGLEAQRALIREAAMRGLSRARSRARDELENLVMGLGVPFTRQPSS